MNTLVYVVEALIVLLLVFSAYYTYYSWKTGVPTVSTSKDVREKMAALIPPGPHHVVEMGSGWGGLAIAAAKARPDCKITAIEYSVVPVLVSRLRLLFNPGVKNLEFLRRDFFDLSLRDADVVFCYLLVPMLKRLRPKFLAELPENAVIISNTYQIPDWTPERTEKLDKFFESGIYIYKKGGALA
jgi:hypothetical protein